MSHRTIGLFAGLWTLLAVAACGEAPTASTPGGPQHSAVKFWEAGSSVRWNRRGIALFRAFGNNPGRIMAYLSLAQYRAALAAGETKQGSLAGAVAGASVVVLKHFYTAAGAVSAIDAELQSQRDATPWPGESQKDFAAGETLGREIAATVLALAANDEFGVSDPGAPPAGPGYWSSATAPVRGGYGAIPILLTPSELVSLIASPPPAFGSADYLSALAEVSSVSAGRTAEQLAIAQKWVPFSGVYFNEIAADLIVAHRRTETEAARIFALGNGAAFDAIIGCFNSKFTYWLIRPSKADLSITTPLGLPNHPSYPSAHNCESGAWEVVLAGAFPSERGALATVVEEASMSRLYAGLHYRFDNEAGLALGRAAGRLALSGKAPE